jgi:hypothetical protein
MDPAQAIVDVSQVTLVGPDGSLSPLAIPAAGHIAAPAAAASAGGAARPPGGAVGMASGERLPSGPTSVTWLTSTIASAGSIASASAPASAAASAARPRRGGRKANVGRAGVSDMLVVLVVSVSNAGPSSAVDRTCLCRR